MITTIKTWLGDIVTIDKQPQLDDLLHREVLNLREVNVKLRDALHASYVEANQLQEACRQLRGMLTQREKEIKCLNCRLDHNTSQYLELLEKVKALLN